VCTAAIWRTLPEEIVGFRRGDISMEKNMREQFCRAPFNFAIKNVCSISLSAGFENDIL